MASALTPGWSPANRRALQQMLDSLGQHSPGYDPARKPYAVFDWDNTCIMNDTEEALLLYQAENLRFKLTPAEFAEVLRQGVPEGVFHADYTNLEGQPVCLQDLAADIDEAYAWLYAHCDALGGTQPLADIRLTEPFKNFRAKFYFLYGALCDTYPMEVGYKWIIYFYKNFTPVEFQAMVAACVAQNLGEALVQAPIHSSAELPGRAGRVAPVHFYGMRIDADMVALMAALRAHGFDVHVSTASMDDVVRSQTALARVARCAGRRCFQRSVPGGRGNQPRAPQLGHACRVAQLCPGPGAAAHGLAARRRTATSAATAGGVSAMP